MNNSKTAEKTKPMTKRLKVYLLIIFAAACLACTLVGCKIGGLTRGELIADYNTHITYYSNGGSFNGSTTLSVREMYLKGGSEGAPFFDITPDTSEMNVKRGAYDFEGWYLPEKYTEGAHSGEIKYYVLGEDKTTHVPVYMVKNGDSIVTDRDTVRPVFAREENGELLDEQILERDVFVECSETRVVGGETIEPNRGDMFGLIVCAKWLPPAKVHYMLVLSDTQGNLIDDNETEYTTTNGKETFKNGDELAGIMMDAQTVTPMSGQRKALEGLTFVKTYPNSDLTGTLQPVKKEDGDVTVYCRYIVGDWTVVSSSSDVRKMFNEIGTEKKFFILQDIEYAKTASAVKARLSSADAANATIVCDGTEGHTISNLKVEVPRANVNDVYSLFGTFGEKLEVSGLTLKDVQITVTATTQPFSFYAICGAYADAKPENVELTLENVTASYTAEQNFNNDTENHWLFGGDESSTDQNFRDLFTGVTLKGENVISAT